MSDGGGGLGYTAVANIARGIVSSIFGGRANINALVAFATNPLRFLRARVIPVILGAIFGFAFDMATLIARPFDAALGSLTLVSSSLSTATGAITEPIGDALSIGSQLVLSATAWAGPLQPFVATAVTLVIAYAVLIAGVRLLRALADSVPVLSGVETFLFG